MEGLMMDCMPLGKRESVFGKCLAHKQQRQIVYIDELSISKANKLSQVTH